MYFNFKTNDRGELIYKRVSCDLGNAIRDLNKELTGGMFGAELQLMQFLEYRFFVSSKKRYSRTRRRCSRSSVLTWRNLSALSITMSTIPT